MCGISGYLHLERDRPATRERLQPMGEVLRHRGPDDEGFLVEGPLGLAHRRLAIIDLQTGQQPMSSSDGKLSLIFNGEIYNYIELRETLRRLGQVFYSDSDTEVILAAYRQWGVACVEHFNGMWAFALWDRSEQRLFCSRDRMGEKPFHYGVFDNTFVFGSEIKALFAWGVEPIPNWEVLDALLCFLYVPAPHTFFKGIAKLQPGHSLIVQDGNIRLQQYYDIPLLPDKDMRRDETAILQEFRELFHDAVRIRMRSDVPFGAFLSGGLDSASVVAAMAGISSRPVRTCTIGFADPSFDERHLARLVADKYATEHFDREVDYQDAEALMQKLAWHYDEPFGDSSALPTFLVSRIARERVKMVLTGDGGDEVLSGYRIHQEEYLGSLAAVRKQFYLPSLFGLVENVSPGSVKRRAGYFRKVLERSRLDLVGRLESLQNGFSGEERLALLGHRSDVRPAVEFIEEIVNPYRNYSDFSCFNYWYLRVSLPDDMLCKVDRASMANSLETRIPFLDPRLVELLVSVAPIVKLKHGGRKHILRKSLGNCLPPELLKARKKGFSIPLANWIKKGSFLERHALNTVEAQCIDPGSLRSILDKQISGKKNNANGIWLLGMLSQAIALTEKKWAVTAGQSPVQGAI